MSQSVLLFGVMEMANLVTVWGDFHNTMSWRCCVSLWKQKYFVWASKKRTQLEIIGYNTVPEQFNPNI